MSEPQQNIPHAAADLDVVIVGAGFAGVYALHKLRQCGFSVRVIEAGGGVGGTWYWNRYPGCRCDIESMHYSYQFDDALQQEWEWSELYATQPEILDYINHVADRYELRTDIQFNTRVTAAAFQDGGKNGPGPHWLIETDTGEHIRARYCVMATGVLSSPNLPEIEGRNSFAGDTYHTGRWPHGGVDFTGRRVAVIGTGSSAIQSIPLIAQQAEQLTVFQRTPNFAIPARNRPYNPNEVAEFKANYGAIRAEAKRGFVALPVEPAGPSALTVSVEERDRIYEDWWQVGGLLFQGAFADLLFDKEANETAADFVRRKILEKMDDPELADLLMPKSYFACKRLCVETNYYETYNRPNVSLVDVSERPIDCIVPEGIRMGETTWDVDAIVFATGYDAMTGALLDMDIRGRDGLPLHDKWAAGPVSYLGLMIYGFPNLFTINGPGSPSVLVNMVTGIEQHVDWITGCLMHMREAGLQTIEATAADEDAWVAHNREVGSLSIRSACGSWYLGANIPGKPRVFMPYVGGFPAYVEKCEAVVRDGYAGFTLV